MRARAAPGFDIANLLETRFGFQAAAKPAGTPKVCVIDYERCKSRPYGRVREGVRAFKTGSVLKFT